MTSSPSKSAWAAQLGPDPKYYSNTEIQSLLSDSDLSYADKNLILCVYETAEKLRIWREEVEDWPWTGDFEEIGMREGPSESLPGTPDEPKLAQVWAQREDRLDEISDALDNMDLADMKSQVLRIHNENSAQKARNRDIPEEHAMLMYNEYELFATQMIVQAIPDLELLRRALRSWSLRLIVLKEMPKFLAGFKQAQKWSQEAEQNLQNQPVEYGAESIDKLTAELRACSDCLEKRIADLGLTLDRMLDALEASDDTIPDHWIDGFEHLEDFYGIWAAKAEMRFVELQLKKIDVSKPSTMASGHDRSPQALAGVTNVTIRSAALTMASLPQDLPTSASKAREISEAHNQEHTSTSAKLNGFGTIVHATVPATEQHSTKGLVEAVSPIPATIPSSQEAVSGPQPGQTIASHVVENSDDRQPLAGSMNQTIDHDFDPMRAQVDGADYQTEQIRSIGADLAVRPSSRGSIHSEDEDVDPSHFYYTDGDSDFERELHEEYGSDLDDIFVYSELEHSPIDYEPTSPIGSWNDSPSIPRMRPLNRTAEAPVAAVMPKTQVLEVGAALTAARRAVSGHEDEPTALSTPVSKRLSRKPSARAKLTPLKTGDKLKSPTLPIQQQLSELISTLPTPINLVASGKMVASSPSSPPSSRTVSNSIDADPRTPHDRTSSLIRAFERSKPNSPTTPQPLPTLTLTAVDDPASKRRTGAFNSEIKLYHLSAPGRTKPVKLYIRRTGENSDRLMVRVGGGWADLGDYLRAYAAHHLSSLDVNLRSLPSASSHTDARHRRVASSATNGSIDEEIDGVSVLRTSVEPTSPLEPFNRSQTPSDAVRDPHSRRSISPWTVDTSSMSLAGPMSTKRSKKQEISSEKKEWVEGIVEQARRTVSANHSSAAATAAARAVNGGRSTTPQAAARSGTANGGRSSPAEPPSGRSLSRLSGSYRRLSIDGVDGAKGKKLWLRSKD